MKDAPYVKYFVSQKLYEGPLQG